MARADDMTFADYWRTYLPDLIGPLGALHRERVVNALARSFVSGAVPSRASVQRLAELSTGVITMDQHRSWAVSRPDPERSIDAALAAARGGRFLGGDRGSFLRYLASWPYGPRFAEQVRAAHAAGELDDDELRTVLATSLRLPPLPPIRPRPKGVPAAPRRRHRSPGYVVRPAS